MDAPALLAPALLFAGLVMLPAQTTHTLTTGTGAGSISVSVDGFGAYGDCFTINALSDLSFNDGAVARKTTCGSALLVHENGVSPPVALVTYTTGGFPAALPGPTIQVNVAGQDIQSSWTVGNFDFTLRQQVFGPDPVGGPVVDGSTLVQTYTITNNDPTFATHVLDFARWVDGDIIATSGDFTDDFAGATADLATAGGVAPFFGNGHAVFQYDPNLNFVMMISLDVITDTGVPLQNDRWQAIDNSGAAAWAPMGTSAASGLSNSVAGDGDFDLLQDAGIDSAMALGATNLTVQPTLTTTIITRTRLSFLDQTSATPLPIQARDLTGTAFNGNYPGAGAAGLLCVNGQSGVVAVPSGTPWSLNLGLPSGTGSGLYFLAAAVGSPLSGNLCAPARTLDHTVWGAPIAPLGTGAFPLSIPGLLASTGGGGPFAAGIAISDVPGFGIITGLPASGGVPCGGTILGPLVSSNLNLSLTLQSLGTDVASPSGISISNAVVLALGACPTPTL